MKMKPISRLQIVVGLSQSSTRHQAPKFLSAFGIALAIGIALALPNVARAKSDQHNNRTGQVYFAARVKAGNPTLGNRVKLCPIPGGGHCPTHRYLVAGDVALVNEVRGTQAHIVFVNRVGKWSEGWLARAQLVRLPVSQEAQSGWAGTWATDEKEIKIWQSRGDGFLIAQGTATWGADDPERVQRGAVHLGDFLAKFRPHGDMAAFAEGDETDHETGLLFRDSEGYVHKTLAFEAKRAFICKVRLRKIGIYLVVEDNGNCGGANVTFSDVYRKIGR